MEVKSSSARYKAVIITALKVEYEAVRAHLENLTEAEDQGTIYERGTFSANDRTWDVGILDVGAGNPRAAVETEHAILYFKPQVAMFVGVAGGIKDVHLGDIVAATKIYGYASGKAQDQFLPRPDVGETSYPLQQRARIEGHKQVWLSRVKPRSLTQSPRPPEVFIGPIAAGEIVLSSTRSPVYQFLRHEYSDALAVEMEGRGFLVALHANPYVMGMVIRGISDRLDGKARADAAGWQPKASRYAAAFAFQILAEYKGGIQPISQPDGQPERPTRFYQIPLPPSDFTGREADLEYLVNSHANGYRRALIHGLAGIGKSVFAFALAKILAAYYPDGQIYLDMLGTSSQPVTASQAMGKVIRLFRPVAPLPDDFVDLSTIYNTVLREKRLLILFDNTRFKAQVEQLNPPEGCYMLVTSRWRLVIPGMKIRRLQSLPLENAIELLISIDERLKHVAGRLAELCGNVPLALRVSASALAEQPSLPVAEFMQKFEQADTRQQLTGMEASLQVSYELLEPGLQDRLAFLSVFPAPFDRPSAAAVWNVPEEAAQKTLDSLLYASLLEWDQGIYFHLLTPLRTFAAGKLSLDEQQVAQERLAEYKRKVDEHAKDNETGLTVSST